MPRRHSCGRRCSSARSSALASPPGTPGQFDSSKRKEHDEKHHCSHGVGRPDGGGRGPGIRRAAVPAGARTEERHTIMQGNPTATGGKGSATGGNGGDATPATPRCSTATPSPSRWAARPSRRAATRPPRAATPTAATAATPRPAAATPEHRTRQARARATWAADHGRPSGERLVGRAGQPDGRAAATPGPTAVTAATPTPATSRCCNGNSIAVSIPDGAEKLKKERGRHEGDAGARAEGGDTSAKSGDACGGDGGDAKATAVTPAPGTRPTRRPTSAGERPARPRRAARGERRGRRSSRATRRPRAATPRSTAVTAATPTPATSSSATATRCR